MITGRVSATMAIETRDSDGELFIDITAYGHNQLTMSFDVKQSKALIDKLVFLRNVQLNYQPKEGE
jgi:hypothetical protein